MDFERDKDLLIWFDVNGKKACFMGTIIVAGVEYAHWLEYETGKTRLIPVDESGKSRPCPAVIG